MVKALLILLYLSIFSITIGPLAKLPLAIENVSLYISDIFVALIWVVLLKYSPPRSPFGPLRGDKRLSTLARRIKDSDKISQSFSIFVLIALLSLIFTPISLTFFQRIVSFLYLLRLVGYFGVYFAVSYLIKMKKITKNQVINLLGATGVTLAIVGWFQYFLYPDLRNLYYLGWDPHYLRIFATYLDPNFLGLIFVFTLIILFSQSDRGVNALRWLVRFFVLVTLAFTYSRSSYFAAMVVSLLATLIKRKISIALFALSILTVSILLLPRPSGEGVRLERLFSIRERIESWQQGLKIFTQYPILGVGFNTMRYAKIKYFPEVKQTLVNHSGAGVENSFIFIAATTGVVGLISYTYFLYQAFSNSGILSQLTILAAIVHGLFLNSLLFPWIVMWLFLMLAADYSS